MLWSLIVIIGFITHGMLSMMQTIIFCKVEINLGTARVWQKGCMYDTSRTPTSIDVRMIFEMHRLTHTLIFSQRFFWVFKIWCYFKLVSATFYQIFIFLFFIKFLFFISSKKLLSFWRYSNFCNFFPFHIFQIQKDKWKWSNLWCHELTGINLQM